MFASTGRMANRLLLAWLAASAAAPFLHLDALRVGMLLTYPPRILCAVPALLVALLALGRRRYATACLSGLSVALFLASLQWGGATFSRPAAVAASSLEGRGLAILSFNANNKAATIGPLRELVDREEIDILNLQEVRLNNRKRFTAAFPDFLFNWADPSKLTNRGSGVFASTVAIRRSRLGSSEEVQVETGITGYRTFAVLATLGGRRAWIVNVHATKPFWLEDGLLVLLADAPGKARWHYNEHRALASWVEARSDEAVLVAGDFNAPSYGHAMRLPGLRSAHREVGRGLGLTVPAPFPLWGIDHTLGNERVRFREYRVVEVAPSDHRAQLARFDLH